MPTRQEFKALSLLRLKEAQILAKKQCFDGACYLAGYTIELALKAAICKNMKSDKFFDIIKTETSRAFKIHNIEELITLAGLREQFESLKRSNADFQNHWNSLNAQVQWSEQLRYQMDKTEQQTQSMLNAISDNQNGLLKWIKRHW